MTLLTTRFSYIPFALVFALASWLTVTVVAAEPLPLAVQALQRQGACLTGSFRSVNGMKVYTASLHGQALALYVTTDGRHVILGRALDDAGQSADDASFKGAAEHLAP